MKDPQRVPDRREGFDGVQVTIFDNRGICQHSGFCTDRLSSVFHAGSEPFVTPAGGRLDEITRAVRDCPSGAPSYAIDGRESREQVDQTGRAPTIEMSRDGPYRITGGLALTDGAGNPEPRAEGASTEHYALCRCGHSQNKPFCSGMHYYINFADPALTEKTTLFEWAGGLPALLRMTEIFYGKYVPEDPLLAPLFATVSPDHPQQVAAWRSFRPRSPATWRPVSPRTSSRCSGPTTATRCASPSICGPTTTSPPTPRRSWRRSGPVRCPVIGPGLAEQIEVFDRWLRGGTP